MEDVEFLTGQGLCKYWVMGWCAAPGVVAPLTLWWVAVVVMDGAWSWPPWPASVVAAAGALAILILITFAAVAVARQVQYDIIGVRTRLLNYSCIAPRSWRERRQIHVRACCFCTDCSPMA